MRWEGQLMQVALFFFRQIIFAPLGDQVVLLTLCHRISLLTHHIQYTALCFFRLEIRYFGFSDLLRCYDSYDYLSATIESMKEKSMYFGRNLKIFKLV